MRIFKLWIGIALVLILGALAGSLGMGIYIKHRFERSIFEDAGPGRPPHPHMMQFLMRRLDKELDLNEIQRREIGTIMHETAEKVHSIMQEKRPQLEKLVQENLEQIKDKLNNGQKEKFDHLKLFERMRNRFPGKPPFGPGMGGERSDEIFGKLKTDLQLTEAQIKEVQPMIEESFEKRRKITEAYGRQVRSIRFARRKEMKELQKTVEKQLENILSDAQMDTYRRFQEEQRDMHSDMRPRDPHGWGADH